MYGHVKGQTLLSRQQFPIPEPSWSHLLFSVRSYIVRESYSLDHGVNYGL